MLSRAALLRSSLQRYAAAPSRRSFAAVAKPALPSSLVKSWYNAFGKSTALYSSWMILLIVIGEFTTGKVTDGLWSANNSGRTFSTMDWSKFDQFDEDDDDDDDDEDDDDE